MKYGGAYQKRLQKLETRIGSYSPESELRAIQSKAWDTLSPTDRMAISHVARAVGMGQEVEWTAELNAVFARWGDATAELMSNGGLQTA